MEISSTRKTALYLLFALSGFCALVYEILWTKYLSLTFGTTMLAVSVVAATFMGGLALGSYLMGRYADRETNLLRVYAFLELGIAVTALLFPATLGGVEKTYVWLHQVVPDSEGASGLFHLVFSVFLLLPPAAFMGGTFPLMCRFFARKKSGGQIGRLYALNTIGATAGAFLAGFLLIPGLGLSATGYLAVAGNLFIAGATFLMSGQVGTTSLVDVSSARRPDEPLKAVRHRFVLVSIGLVGFFSLAYEILWTRVLLLFLGNTSYAFSLMLSAYLVGIALGGAIYARKVRPDLNEKRVFVSLTLLMSLSILITAPFYDNLAYLFQLAHEASGERWWHLSMLNFLLVFGIMCIPTVLSGSLLPAAVAILDPGRTSTGEGVGLVVMYNTVGAVLGSLVAGFVLIPSIGVLGSFRLLATMNVLLGAALYFRFREKIKNGSWIPGLAALGVLLAVIPVQWDLKLMNSGIYCYAPKFAQFGGLGRALESETILGVFEGVETTVAVKENANGSVRYFTVNGKTDGGTGQDMATQLLVGQLPMLLHPSPREVMVIGLGSGITVGGVKEFAVDRVDCAEISPEVVGASVFFEKENRSALKDRKVRLFLEDGRNLLLTREDRFDVIISEPSNPWQTGNANLFTDEFYKLAASRLKTGGVFCQWIGLYDITLENLQVATATFLQTFPKVRAFQAGADLILIGSFHDIDFDYSELQRRMKPAGIAQVLSSVGIYTPADLIASHYLLSDTTLRRFSHGAKINSDDRPILEYSAHLLLGEKMFGKCQMENVMALTRAKQDEELPLVNLGASNVEIASTLRELGKSFFRANKKGEATYFMQRAYAYEAAGAKGDKS